MKITAMHIYQYGKFSDRSFQLSDSPVQVIYGLNEAGKTTLMSFIKSVLFGFPKSKKYEPKNGGVYGGTVELKHGDHGAVKIERTKGAAEKVRVYTASGEIKDGEWLKQLLSDTDRALYEAIYSFDVFGLQEIQAFNRDKIGEFLLYSSLFGSEAAAKLDGRLAKELDRMYKPNGRNPRLNQELDTLKRLSAQLKQAEAAEAGYHSLLEEKKSAGGRLQDAEARLKDIAEEIKTVKSAIEAKPLADKKTALESELSSYPDALKQFPKDGMHQLEKYESHLHPKAARLEGLRAKAAELRRQAELLAPNEDLLQTERQLQELSGEQHMYESRGEQLAAIQSQIRQTSARVLSGLQQLGRHEEDGILSLNTDYEYEWRLQEAVQSAGQARERKTQLDAIFEQARLELEEAERKHALTAENILDPAVRKEKEAALQSYKQTADTEGNEWQAHVQQLEKQRAKQKKLFLGAGILFIAIFAMLKEWLPAALFTGALLLYMLSGMQKPLPSERGGAGHKKKKPTISKEAADLLQEELWRDGRHRQQLIADQAVLEQKEAAYERVIRQYEEWEAEMAPSEKQAELFMKELGFSGSPSHLLDAYHVMKDVKKEILNKHELTIEAGRLQKLQRAFEDRVKKLSPSDGRELSVKERLRVLLAQAERAREEAKRKQALETDLLHAQEQMRELNEEVHYYEQQVKQLFMAAGAKNREHFCELARLNESRRETERQLREIKTHLSGIGGKQLEPYMSRTVSELEHTVVQKETEKKTLEEKSAQLREKTALLTVKQEQLESSGLVSDLKQQTEMQKERVKKTAKEWAALQTVRHIIREKMERHKKVTLPRLLETAGALYGPLTDGRYRKLYFSEADDSIMVMRKDGTVFSAGELSQAACEQLYAAIRFALASERESAASLPFLLDDSFVHFDRQRLERLFDVLNQLSEGGRQILYFTCHEHVSRSFHSGQVMRLLS
ncbi:AAA family ATPase [Bacillus velezensis]|uniref:ATP-binding protein n=1 Tax=Bacillus amyloliquefaciens group TaxID=1938374 RepID=UPI0013750678|nr:MULTISPECIES: AAA family ATPase [Bacillus amyloliquefaciens group]MCT6861908.1 AAA family ATPase [Bacillus velezensis]QOX76480.1 AAA family ATPase [Bacillus velezensis]QVV94798.1 AAA family ATPase [Bacillus amyloliquefaciens]QYR14426.1 AAA family ATPase [Bacillus velezensis]WKU37914.1 AAA family ATPase [Bacillus amyloliquefaciens]